MIYQAFTIFDTKALSYSPPFFQATKGLAIRMFSETALDKSTTIGRHPTDFTLFYLGNYDDQTATLRPEEAGPTPIIKASETINREEPEPVKIVA